MPAGGGAAGQLPGQDAIDLKVCMNLLKKAIVLLPLLIMLIIFIIRKTMTYPPAEEGEGVTIVDSLEWSNRTLSNDSSILSAILAINETVASS